MKDIRKLPRLDFAASPWQHRNYSTRIPPRKSANAIDLSPRLELSLSVVSEADPEIPETEN
jgi:hypothetical protein